MKCSNMISFKMNFSCYFHESDKINLISQAEVKAKEHEGACALFCLFID